MIDPAIVQAYAHMLLDGAAANPLPYAAAAAGIVGMVATIAFVAFVIVPGIVIGLAYVAYSARTRADDEIRFDLSPLSDRPSPTESSSDAETDEFD